MKTMWVLSGSIVPGDEIKRRKCETFLFSDFDSAKAHFRAMLCEYATKKTSARKDFEQGIECYDGFDDLDEAEKEQFKDAIAGHNKLMQIIHALFSGEDAAPLCKGKLPQHESGMIAYHFGTKQKHPVLVLEGDGDGPYNDVDPTLYTNAIIMDNPNLKYFCIAEPLFDNYDNEPSRICIDLVPAETAE